MISDLLNIDPVAFSIGPLVIRWYALAYLAGFILGWRYCVYLIQKRSSQSILPEHIEDFLTWAVIGVVIGGRLGYVAFYQPAAYMANPVEIFKVWNGGMSFHGGVSGVIVSMLLFARFKKVPLFELSDLVSAAAPIGLLFGRLANFINGELYGRVTESSFGVVFPNGGDLPRHPSQLYEAALEGLLLFVVLFVLSRSVTNRPGLISGVFLLGYGVFRALIEFVREPDMQIGLIGGFISMGQILCLPMILGGAVLVVFALSRKLSDAKPA